MRSILLITPTKTTAAKLRAYVEVVREATTAQVVVCPIDEVSVTLAPGEFTVYDHRNRALLADYDFVLFRGRIKHMMVAHVICRYLALHQVGFAGGYQRFRMPNKLIQAVDFYEAGVPFLLTIFCLKRARLYQLMTQRKLLPAILKPVIGSGGDNNHLMMHKSDRTIIDKQTPRLHLLAQRYQPATGDYRLLFFGKSVVARYRTANNSHIHNYSKGATIQSVSLTMFSPQLLRDAKKLVRCSGLTIAGVDVIIDTETKQYYFLEINAQPGWGKLKTDIHQPLSDLLEA